MELMIHQKMREWEKIMDETKKKYGLANFPHDCPVDEPTQEEYRLCSCLEERLELENEYVRFKKRWWDLYYQRIFFREENENGRDGNGD